MKWLLTVALLSALPVTASATSFADWYDIRVWVKPECANEYLKFQHGRGVEFHRVKKGRDFVLLSQKDTSLERYIHIVTKQSPPEVNCVIAVRAKDILDPKFID